MNIITATNARTFRCACGREFVAATDARIGVTKSNANRHGAACLADAETVTPTAPYGTTHVSLAGEAEAEPAGAEAVQLAFEGADAVFAACAAAVEAEEPLLITPSGKVAKMVRVNLALRHTTDGRHFVAKLGEGEEAWTLFSFDPARTVRAQQIAKFATCTAALAVADGRLVNA